METVIVEVYMSNLYRHEQLEQNEKKKRETYQKLKTHLSLHLGVGIGAGVCLTLPSQLRSSRTSNLIVKKTLVEQ